MTDIWRATLSRKYATVIDALEAPVRDCPGELWESSLWEVKKEHPGVWPVQIVDSEGSTDVAEQERLLQTFSAFWNLAYHAIFHVDFYLSGARLPYQPPAPFREEEHHAHVVPARIYTPAELQTYLAHCRAKARETFATLTDEEAERPLPRTGQPFAELLLHNLLHAQEHAAQLSVFLGQRGVEPKGGVEAEQQRQGLRDGVRGRDDAEIDAFVAVIGGYDWLLPLVFERVCADMATREPTTVHFPVGPGFIVRVTPGGVTVDSGVAPSPDATVHISRQDFLRWMTSDLDPTAAIGDGRIRVEGDVAALGRLFGPALVST